MPKISNRNERLVRIGFKPLIKPKEVIKEIFGEDYLLYTTMELNLNGIFIPGVKVIVITIIDLIIIRQHKVKIEVIDESVTYPVQ